VVVEQLGPGEPDGGGCQPPVALATAEARSRHPVVRLVGDTAQALGEAPPEDDGADHHGVESDEDLEQRVAAHRLD
jgi:hypothetical protein